MRKKSICRFSFGMGLIFAALMFLSACANKSAKTEPLEPQITEAELLAYCPLVTLRAGTAFYNTYQSGGQDDPTMVVYQAAIRDVTRTCQTSANTLSMKVAAAGRVVPGPKFKAGTITMPIRVVVVQGERVLYSKLHRYPVKINNSQEATQFIFSDDHISLPKPTAKNLRVYVGFDEGAKK
ncbi:hypothetical protein [Bartonella tamiae]|uniref:Lipoprotein n=1 Tax=Bartonella tamiae Th239 TaxID=1094558 RepID=J1JZI5_9HYPH|nr:hypothetical protein [Bartonella tamiae]EJF90532.1 hypothetical protein ME5_00933 [Bartonella tamiae Th239]EJF93524.1 hypothetical protein MEG_00948 [Bartonella tamiae Th307]